MGMIFLYFKLFTILFSNTTFSTPTDKANVSKVENCFGATHPGGNFNSNLHNFFVTFSIEMKAYPIKGDIYICLVLNL